MFIVLEYLPVLLGQHLKDSSRMPSFAVAPLDYFRQIFSSQYLSSISVKQGWNLSLTHAELHKVSEMLWFQDSRRENMSGLGNAHKRESHHSFCMRAPHYLTSATLFRYPCQMLESLDVLSSQWRRKLTPKGSSEHNMGEAHPLYCHQKLLIIHKHY